MRREKRTATRMLVFGAVALALSLLLPALAAARTYSGPTYSSPIALSADGKLLWTVNPGGDNVAVIRTGTNQLIRTIKVGDEPQGVALDPNNRYAYVANAAGSSVTVIRITDPRPNRFKAKPDKRVSRSGSLTTGAEPWNIVTSPDGRRVFVANSAQDTITVLDGTTTRVRTRIGRRIRIRIVPPHVIGAVKLRGSACNPDRERHFQPRALAVTKNGKRLYVTSFLSFVRPGGQQARDDGKQGLVCRLNIKTKSKKIKDYKPAGAVAIAPRETGFTVDSTGDGVADPTTAFPNQMQSLVIRGSQAYLPNIAASPQGPLKFDVSTQAFVNVIDGVNGSSPVDASGGKFLNLHLGARDPEPGKKKLFFANLWAIAFTNQSGSGNAYAVSAGSDLLVKVNVAPDGKLSFTGDADTTRYIDLNDPSNPATSGFNAGKNPQGIVINKAGTRAYVNNFVSRNVSVVDLPNDRVLGTIRTAALPAPGSQDEVVLAGAEGFFSTRGNYNRPPGTTGSTSERLAQVGWQGCASCHFKGLTDGVIWAFASGPRKSVPLNASFNPNNRADQRIFNYSAIFDEVEDFDANVRNISGPGPLATAKTCNAPPPATSTFDPNHGLIIGDNGSIDIAPCVINSLAAKANANRPQVTVTLPGSTTSIPAFTAIREWIRAAVRTPNGPLTKAGVPGRLSPSLVSAGRALFTQAGCAGCHLGSAFTQSRKDFNSPPAATEISTETTPPPLFGKPAAVPYLNRFLKNIGSFNLGVPGAGNPIGANVGGAEKATAALVAGVAQPAPDALGTDYNGDGKGNGYNVPSLLGIEAVEPYYHNGACETLACVVGNPKHRTANGTRPDGLPNARQRAAVTAFLRTITAKTGAP